MLTYQEELGESGPMPLLFDQEDAEACMANLETAISFLKRVATATAAMPRSNTDKAIDASQEIGKIIGMLELEPPDDRTLALLVLKLSNVLADFAEAAEPLLPG